MVFSGRRRLSYLYAREGWRRVSRRLSVGRVSSLRFTGSTPGRLIVAPTDLRAVDPFVAEEILEGRFPLAGRVLDTEGESPFEIDLPSLEFATRLHSFGWLRHLRAIREDAGFVRLRQIVDDWIATTAAISEALPGMPTSSPSASSHGSRIRRWSCAMPSTAFIAAS